MSLSGCCGGFHRPSEPIDSLAEEQPLLQQSPEPIAEVPLPTLPQGLAPLVDEPSTDSGCLDPQYWSCPGAAGFKLRGQNYLRVSVI